MSVSRPSVHPVDAPPMTDGANVAPPRVRMKDIPGMPGTAVGLALRLFQFLFALISLSVMLTTTDFPTVTAFSCDHDYVSPVSFIEVCMFLLRSSSFSSSAASVGLQTLWSLALAVIDIYALLVRRSLRNPRVMSLFTIGDGITSTLTYAAACASAGITVLISNDLDKCNVNHCKRFMSATAMAFISWFATLPSFFLNFWSLASH
ncbi:hypothetical protein LguiA_016115 [Lonicera macranthoides]